MASSQIVQILLRALLELLKKAISKASAPVRKLWTVLRLLVMGSRTRSGHIDQDSTRHATTHTTLPPSLDSLDAPVPSVLTSSSPNDNGAGPRSSRTLAIDIQSSFPGRNENPDTEGANEIVIQPTDASLIELGFNINPSDIELQPMLPSYLRRYERNAKVYVSSHHLLGY